ncbi:mechanosensitive ion channel family protein [Roseibium aquae]|uniref:mechanosensitive ion channel family protein n=1 Tax=Roseibium aquae TaxID=1323746 RepID=UPI001AD8E796|nr:mechanosensitive ion channel family protein [Roseibium aquae]
MSLRFHAQHQAPPVLRFLRVLLLAVGLVAGLGCANGTGAAHAQGALGVLTAQKDDRPAETAPQSHSAASTHAAASLSERTMLQEQLDMAQKARGVLLRILNEIPTFSSSITATLRAKGPDGTLGWLAGTLVSIAVAVAAGLVSMTLISRWGRAQFAHFYRATAQNREDKLGYLFFRAALMSAGLVIFVLVAGLIALFLVGGAPGGRETAFVVLSKLTFFLFIRIVFLNLLVPDTPTHRLFPLSDANASGLYRSLLLAAGIAAVMIGLCNWMERLGLPQDPHKLALIGASFLSMFLLSAIAVTYRAAIAALIQGEANKDPVPMWRRVLAGGWHIFAIVYFLMAWAISSIRLLLDLPDATGLVTAPLLALLAASVAFGALLLVIDRLLLPRLDTRRAQARLIEDILRRDESSEGETDLESASAQAAAEAADQEAARKPFRDLLDKGAALIVMFGGLYLLTSMWGVPIAGHQSFMGSLIEILLVGFVAYMAYEAVKTLIDRKIANTSPSADSGEDIEIGGTGESRIATLLPIFRNFLLITIVVIAAMLVLSELGVNIGPLFAGAGVVGLAIGFGAQTLIRDIFSGAFYLIDDAFRKGEYIDIGSAKGTVEKISIRSMQLRHHRGALTTIPFGDIKQVQNFSRDWAMMKLAFRVTYDTDVDKMRKIIKNFGQELMDDPHFGPMFLQPLKSQGILSMEDSAMIARVKFMTKPGKQFELRKVVYAGLRDLFQKNGIEFANRQVTVRVATADDDEPMGKKAASSLGQAAAGAAAAAAMMEEEANAKGSGDQL